MKIAIYSGSFNPIHNGHIGLAEFLLESTDIERMWLVPSPQNPLKKQSDLLPDDLRLKMAKLAVEDHPNMEVSDVEFHLPKPNYTINTLDNLHKKYPNDEFSLVIGADNMAVFDQWKDYQKILDNYSVMVYPRAGYSFADCRFPEMKLVDAPFFPFSSTAIRLKLSYGLCVMNDVPEKVAEFIAERKLYRI